MRRNELYLRHILDEIAFLHEVDRGLTYDGLLTDPLRQRGIVRSIEIIGEATKNLSEDLKEQYPNIPWRLIAGSRDKLIHAYFEVDWRIVWNILQNEIPVLENGGASHACRPRHAARGNGMRYAVLIVPGDEDVESISNGQGDPLRKLGEELPLSESAIREMVSGSD